MNAFRNPREAGAVLEAMLAIRRFEETVFRLFTERKFTGHYHLYIGQEATAVGAIGILQPADLIFTTHRNHGHLLARGADPRRAFAEILGRRDGFLGGRGGTFHLAAPALGIPHTSALVGGCTALAIGAAYSLKSRRLPQVAAVFFGDGALEEGVTYEALNIASLWRLPVVFICENNAPGEQGRKGDASPASLAAERLSAIPRALSIETRTIDGADADLVAETVGRARESCIAGDGPVFIECVTRGWPGNAGQWPDMVTGETRIEMAWEAPSAPGRFGSWYEQDDPVLRFCRTAIATGTLSRDTAMALDEQVGKRMRAVAEEALSSPPPEAESARAHVFA